LGAHRGCGRSTCYSDGAIVTASCYDDSTAAEAVSTPAGEPFGIGARGLTGTGDARRGDAMSTRIVRLAGVPFAALRRLEVVDRVFEALGAKSGGWIITANTDLLLQCIRDAELRVLYEKAAICVADGHPLLWAARLQGTPLPDRVAGSDLVWLLAERAAQEGRSLYLLGGETGVGPKAARRLVEHTPALRIAGTSSPWISTIPTEEEIASVVSDLRAARPDLVYVALGSPKTERLAAELRDQLPDIWLIGVGISLSFIAGTVRRAPRWMQRLGLEWFHRLVQEPRRLAPRYVFHDLPFGIRLLGQALCNRYRRAAASRDFEVEGSGRTDHESRDHGSPEQLTSIAEHSLSARHRLEEPAPGVGTASDEDRGESRSPRDGEPARKPPAGSQGR